MASPQLSPIADNQSPIASVKRPRSQVLAGHAQQYDQIFSINTAESSDKKDDSFEAYYKISPKAEGRLSEESAASSLHEELFSPQLTLESEVSDEEKEEESARRDEEKDRKEAKESVIRSKACKSSKPANAESAQSSKPTSENSGASKTHTPTITKDAVKVLKPHSVTPSKEGSAIKSPLKRSDSAQSAASLSSSSSLGEPELEFEPDDVEETISLEEEEEAAAQAPLREQEFNPYLFMQRLPPYEHQVSAAYRRRRLLPPQKAPPPPRRRDRTSSTGASKTKSDKKKSSGSGPLAVSGSTGALGSTSKKADTGGGAPVRRGSGGRGAAPTRREQARRADRGPLNGSLVSRELPIKKRPTLVLDLDETLVHCTVQPSESADIVFPVLFNGVNYQVHVHKRPHLDHFLTQVRELYEVVVFTASQKVYADALLDILDPDHQYIEHRLFRDDCLEVERNFLKDLEILGRDLARVILVDNSPYAYGYQIDNGVPIISWFDDEEDTELLKLLPFLETLAKVQDVRPIIRKQFKTYLLIQNA